MCDEYRLAIRYTITKAWKNRRKIGTKVVNELPCYVEAAPYEKRGLLVLDPRRCEGLDPECCLADSLRQRKDDLSELISVLKTEPVKPENQRRRKTLRQIARTPKKLVTDENCRHLGDAYFALFSPEDAEILTTNKRDLEPLARALGKKVSTPP